MATFFELRGDTVRKIGLNIDVPGKRPKGRPKQRWLDALHVDLKVAGIHPDQAFDRVKWLHQNSGPRLEAGQTLKKKNIGTTP
ncbi:unnamed protein product [Heligmosomoides polygyrus]|uniref:MOSC domain-containing protein n=1 Tax=Heligmosomoides polygyrus TaxID=6339 RepID=A0A183G179_HELPZ|nr:unnamed protein product [Heligmosomoides polygyrus]